MAAYNNANNEDKTKIKTQMTSLNYGVIIFVYNKFYKSLDYI